MKATKLSITKPTIFINFIANGLTTLLLRVNHQPNCRENLFDA